ncbi:uncharacterized protein UV8b_04338 [Ustilaginoidea virens]|uniref:Uncharacterized protein n=1 Tax=Ustilaginoidea virens TaxID=1159556 RepID=A0A8E5HRD7_USTVR|nr:uncharacterized protein UV8b_04338 [Ustilaginoidea virens]QUC20097.1 hypothetical protein UV8b_04338 [Ustilaginoidea virens]
MQEIPMSKRTKGGQRGFKQGRRHKRSARWKPNGDHGGKPLDHCQTVESADGQSLEPVNDVPVDVVKVQRDMEDRLRHGHIPIRRGQNGMLARCCVLWTAGTVRVTRPHGAGEERPGEDLAGATSASYVGMVTSLD